MAVLDSPSLLVLTVSVDVDLKVESCGFGALRVQELCESRGGRLGPSLLVLTVSVDVKQH